MGQFAADNPGEKPAPPKNPVWMGGGNCRLLSLMQDKTIV